MNNHYDSAPPTAENNGNMKGFDAEFTDIVDYITRITYRIWEGKQVGLCRRYYSEDCPIYTLSGVVSGSEQVVQNTVATLSAFPDRTLKPINIIWGGDDQQGYHSSHLISSVMTNHGSSEFGEATGKQVIIPVIAHCIVKDNKVIEEWLVRDNYSLAEQLGRNPQEIAQQWASKSLDGNNEFAIWRNSEIKRVFDTVSNKRNNNFTDALSDPEGYIRNALQNIWNAHLFGNAFNLYADDTQLLGSANRPFKGPDEIIKLYTGILGALPDAKHSIDYVCSIPYGDDGVDIAVRWTLAGTHTGKALYGEPTGGPILIIGESHYRVVNNRVIEETTVFDELSVLTQIYRARLAALAKKS